MPNIYGDMNNRGLSAPYYKGDLRGAIAIAVERFLTNRITVLVCDYSRTLRLMEGMDAVRRDQPAIWKFPVDWQTVGSVPLTERTYSSGTGFNYDYFEPGGGANEAGSTGFRGIAKLAREHNDLSIATYEVAMRKVETAIPWYTQDVTISNSPVGTEFVSRLMQRLVQGQALEINQLLWNFNAVGSGTWGDGNTVNYKQSEQLYSIPFVVNTPRFAHVSTDGTPAGNTVLKALVADGVSSSTTVFYSQDGLGARSQDVGGLVRSTTTRRYWSVPHVALNDETGEKVVRRTNHVWSGLIANNVANYTGTTPGIGGNARAQANNTDLTFIPVKFRDLGMLYHNIQASNYTMPDVAITHPELMAWMDDQVWTRRQFTSADMRAVFGNQVSFFLDTPVYADVMVSPVIVPNGVNITNLAPGDKLYSMYFLTMRNQRGLALMLNNSTRPVQKRDVPVPADYFMGAYYIQLALLDPLAQGFAVNLKP